jgi:hypothetical protein
MSDIKLNILLIHERPNQIVWTELISYATEYFIKHIALSKKISRNITWYLQMQHVAEEPKHG